MTRDTEFWIDYKTRFLKKNVGWSWNNLLRYSAKIQVDVVRRYNLYYSTFLISRADNHNLLCLICPSDSPYFHLLSLSSLVQSFLGFMAASEYIMLFYRGSQVFNLKLSQHSIMSGRVKVRLRLHFMSYFNTWWGFESRMRPRAAVKKICRNCSGGNNNWHLDMWCWWGKNTWPWPPSCDATWHVICDGGSVTRPYPP